MLCHQRTQLHSAYTVLDGGCCLFLPFFGYKKSCLLCSAFENNEWDWWWPKSERLRVSERERAKWKKASVKRTGCAMLKGQMSARVEKNLWLCASVKGRSKYECVPYDHHKDIYCISRSLRSPFSKHFLSSLILKHSGMFSAIHLYPFLYPFLAVWFDEWCVLYFLPVTTPFRVKMSWCWWCVLRALGELGGSVWRCKWAQCVFRGWSGECLTSPYWKFVFEVFLNGFYVLWIKGNSRIKLNLTRYFAYLTASYLFWLLLIELPTL